MDDSLTRMIEAWAIGMLVGLAVSVVILTLRIACDRYARLGLRAILTRKRGR